MLRRRRPLARAAVVGGVGAATYHAGKKNAANQAHEADQDAAIDSANQQQAAPQQYQQPAAPAPAASTESVADQLTKLKALLDAGVLTEGEFEAQKAKILAG